VLYINLDPSISLYSGEEMCPLTSKDVYDTIHYYPYDIIYMTSSIWHHLYDIITSR